MTESQLKGLKEDDAKVQSDYLTTEPKTLDVGLKSNENVARILANWGKWFNEIFINLLNYSFICTKDRY